MPSDVQIRVLDLVDRIEEIIDALQHAHVMTIEHPHTAREKLQHAITDAQAARAEAVEIAEQL
jgi:hypothetical protein